MQTHVGDGERQQKIQERTGAADGVDGNTGKTRADDRVTSHNENELVVRATDKGKTNEHQHVRKTEHI